MRGGRGRIGGDQGGREGGGLTPTRRAPVLKLVILVTIMTAALSSACAALPKLEDALKSARWMVRDVAAGSPFKAAQKDGRVPGLKLRLDVSGRPGLPNAFTCTVTDLTGSDRAVTLAYVLSLEAEGALWWDDPEIHRRIAPGRVYLNPVDTGVGDGGEASRYPFSVISSDARAICLAAPLEPPRMTRFVYDSSRDELRVEFDFGLSPLPEAFPSRANAEVMSWEVQPGWAFRRALQHYWTLYPQAFQRRVKKAGIWMPFAPLSVVEKPEDFSFGFREVPWGDWDSLKTDEALGVQSFVYVEPQTNWRALRGSEKGGYQVFMKQLWEDALQGDIKAQATLVSAIERSDGRNDLYLGSVPYTSAAPFGCNADPALPTENWGSWPNKGVFELDQLAGPLGWKKDPPVGLEGVYVDSMEGWGEIHDFRRSHWRASGYPLTFEPRTHRLCLLNFWGTYAFVKELHQRLSAKGLLLMGNDAFFRHWYLAPFVDIPGREYTWITDGRWTPVPDERYLFFRAISGQKPYLMLMNNSYDDGAHMENYFQRSLFWAVYPSMFTGHSKAGEIAYFYNPEWYNRDRALFVKYLPLIRRLDEAGWQPVPLAKISRKGVRLERYGDFSEGTLAFTVHNPLKQPAKVTLTLDGSALGLGANVSAKEWISGKALEVKTSRSGPKVTLELPPDGYAAVGIQP